MAKPSSLLLLPFSLLLPLCLPISWALSDSNSSSTATATNPFSPKAAALRYWSKKTSGNLPRPDFLVSKLSPLTPAKSAAFLRLADENTLSTKLPAFCYWAHLFCFPDLSTSLNFTSYGSESAGRPQTFTSYSNESNHGGQTFSSYGKSGTRIPTNFASYGKSANVIQSTFTGYGENAKADEIGLPQLFSSYTYTSYGKNVKADVIGLPQLFTTYTYTSYRDTSNVGDDTFSSYAKNSEGKFFRESALKQGNALKMPDIEDKMPERSFLPRSIAEKIPFSSARLGELLRVFNSEENSALARIVKRTLGECERAPSRGETKRCVASAEDMIDFAVEVLGREVTVKTTEGLGGNKGTVEIGRVEGINGGRITKSVSCHQSLFPYLVYFCHSVPKVRVYEADILDSKTKQKINRGLAICHIDTSAWGPGHGAFLALGGAPGKIEVCHWIFQNDMTWVVADY